MENRKRFLRDLVLIALLLALAAGLYVTVGRPKDEGATAVVRVDGEVVGRYPLGRDGVFPLNGGTNVLKIEDGLAWMEEADCPDHICMLMGKIHLSGQIITCLPNLLTVTIEGGEDLGVDIIAG